MPKVVVRRVGNATIRRASIDGVQLTWSSTDKSRSKPKQLPAGKHVFQWYVRGVKGQTYGFFFEAPTGVPCVVSPDKPLSADDERDWGECTFILS